MVVMFVLNILTLLA